MIGWLFGFCPWHFKLTDLITAGCGRCFIYNCFARDSLKTSSKHLAIRKVWGEISQQRRVGVTEIWQLQPQVKEKKHTDAINEFRKKCRSIINACIAFVFVCDCHQLGPAQGSWAVVHSDIWHPLRIIDKSYSPLETSINSEKVGELQMFISFTAN